MPLHKSSTFADIITALSYTLDLDENRKLYHAWRVAILTYETSALLPGLPAKEQLFYAALLHDIGAIGYSDYVIHSPSVWPEYSVPFLSGHSTRGAAILGSIPRLEAAAEMVLDHHEWWNGAGYPNGKRGPEISPGGMLIRLADTVETIIQEIPTLTKSQLCFILEERFDQEYPKAYFEAIIAALSQNSLFENLHNYVWLPQRIQEIRTELTDETEQGETRIREVQAAIRVFAQIIDTKHQYTAGHSERVAMYAYYLGKACGLDEQKLQNLRIASLLHDAGKIAIPRWILDKPNKLTVYEFKQIRLHPLYSQQIIALISGFEQIAVVAGQHHEWLSGQGYPHGTKGNEIPFLARFVAVADAFDAIITNRSYQKARSVSTALRELAREAGTHFDPEVVRVAQQTFQTDLPRLANFSPLPSNVF